MNQEEKPPKENKQRQGGATGYDVDREKTEIQKEKEEMSKERDLDQIEEDTDANIREDEG